MPVAPVQNEHGVHRPAQSCGAGELVQRIAVSLLPEMMDQQKGNPQFISQLFENLHLLIVVGIACFALTAAHHLKGVHGYQHSVWML